jgi:hypothetical protein
MGVGWVARGENSKKNDIEKKKGEEKKKRQFYIGKG